MVERTEENQDTQIAQLRDAVRKQIGKSRERRACYRAFCLLMILHGQKVSDVAEALGEHTRTLERWRKRFNDEGLDGLMDDTSPGRPSRLSEQAMNALLHDIKIPPSELGLPGGQWRGKQLQQRLTEHYRVDLSLRQCQRLLKKLHGKENPHRYPS